MSPSTVVCSVCDKLEHECKCVRYCCICTSVDAIKLGVDGLYYCPDCREACEVKLASSRDA